VLLLVIATAAMAGIGWLAPLPDGVRESLLVGAMALAALTPLAAAIGHRRLDPLEIGIAVSLVYFAVFPLRATVVLLELDFPTTPLVLEGPKRDLRLALASATLGLLVGGLAYASRVGPALGARIRLPVSRVAEHPPLLAAITLFVVGLAAQTLILAEYHMPGRLALVEGRTSGLVSAASVFMIVGLGFLARRAAMGSGAAKLVLAFAIASGFAVAIAGQFKEVAVISLLTPLVMWNFTGDRHPSRRLLAATTVAAILVIFPAVSIWRNTSSRIDSANPIAVAQEFPKTTYERNWQWDGRRPFRQWTPLTESLVVVSHRLNGFDQFTVAVRFTGNEQPFQNGATLANLAGGLVPRIVWPGKPTLAIGSWFAENYWRTPPEGEVVPQAVTHPGELWIDFGLPGVIIGLALLGIWYRVAFTALKPEATGTGALFYAIVFVTVIVVDRDLPLVYVTLVQRVAATVLLLVVLTGLMRLRLERRT
jgi:hypothetical protein